MFVNKGRKLFLAKALVSLRSNATSDLNKHTDSRKQSKGIAKKEKGPLHYILEEDAGFF